MVGPSTDIRKLLLFILIYWYKLSKRWMLHLFESKTKPYAFFLYNFHFLFHFFYKIPVPSWTRIVKSVWIRILHQSILRCFYVKILSFLIRNFSFLLILVVIFSAFGPPDILVPLDRLIHFQDVLLLLFVWYSFLCIFIVEKLFSPYLTCEKSWFRFILIKIDT